MARHASENASRTTGGCPQSVESAVLRAFENVFDVAGDVLRAFEDASRTREGRFRYRISLPYRRSLFLVRRASENASHLVVRSTGKRVAVASERPVHPRVGEEAAGDKFRVNGTKEMVEGAGANKESGVRVRGNLLPVRNFELHKRKRPTFSSTLCFY